MTARWFGSYPPGVPHEIDPRAYRSLKHFFEERCARFAERPALDNMGARLTYAEVNRLSAAFAAFLLDGLNLSPGDRLAIMLPNVLQYPIALIGALRAGITVVNVNPLYTSSELAFQLADAGAAAIVVLENFAHALEQALPRTQVQHVITTQVGDLFPALKRFPVNFAVKRIRRMVPPWRIEGAVPFRRALAWGRLESLGEVNVSSDDVAFLQYTGGTTGRPKGAILTHGNMIANIEQTAAWIRPALKEGEETVITALPLYHVFALTANLLVFMRLGGCNVLITNPRDLGGLLRELQRQRFTAITGVNTLFQAMLDADGFEKVARANRGALKIAVGGGMSVQKTVAERWQRAMGVPLLEGYGLTEASPIVCANRFDKPEFTGKLGLPVPSTEVAILDEEGTELPLGEAGEICVRGPQVMRGYWHAEDETRKVLSADGWLRTGDIGRMDEQGYVAFIERRRDVIVVSGFKAYPTEIEDVAMAHSGVKDAAAVGIPDRHSGEVVGLFVVKKDDALTEEALLEHCARHLTGYKLPRRIEFRDRLPKSPIGKTLRRELR